MMYCCSGCRELVSITEKWKQEPGKIFCEACFAKARTSMAGVENDLVDAHVLAVRLEEQVKALNIDWMIGGEVGILVEKLGEICEKVQPVTTMIGKEEKDGMS